MIRTLPQNKADPSRPDLWSEYEIEAKTSLTDRALRNLKHADAFAVFDAHGDIGTLNDTAEGLFYRDTRLSCARFPSPAITAALTQLPYSSGSQAFILIAPATLRPSRPSGQTSVPRCAG
jgi:N-terminal domain of (some) glycogen debranching enzymes